MKNVLRILFFAFAFLGLTKIAEASHNAGGDIQYSYISSTGGTHKYKITMRLYRDNTGIPLPASALIYACSANYPTVTATLIEVGSTGGRRCFTNTFDCVSRQMWGDDPRGFV